ncbi:MAG: amidohydrolase family protein [Pirellulales bacterium]
MSNLKPAAALLAVAALLTYGGVQVSASPEVPGAPQGKPIALVGGTVHTVSGEEIQSGTIVFADGKIVALGTDVEVPDDAEQIDVSGKHVYPGLIESYSNIGLTEIESVRATRDERETGSINPNVTARVAVNPDSELIPVARSNGILVALTVPSGGTVSGKSSLMMLDGWTWEEMTLRSPIAMHVSLGSDSQRESVKEALEDARAYHKARAATSEDPARHPFDSRWEALGPVLDGELPIIVDAESVEDIQTAVAFANQEDLKLIIYGGYSAPDCAELLKKHSVPVIVGGVHRLPRRRSSPYDEPFRVAARLHEAGVTFCISASGRFGASDVRNMPYHVATAAAFGLPQDAAVKSMTLYPAQIFGVADRVGSLEAGKDATLFVSDGPVLDIPSHVERAYIQGREVDLSDRHKRLWEKYKERYQRLGIEN